MRLSPRPLRVKRDGFGLDWKRHGWRDRSKWHDTLDFGLLSAGIDPPLVLDPVAHFFMKRH